MGENSAEAVLSLHQHLQIFANIWTLTFYSERWQFSSQSVNRQKKKTITAFINLYLIVGNTVKNSVQGLRTYWGIPTMYSDPGILGKLEMIQVWFYDFWMKLYQAYYRNDMNAVVDPETEKGEL